MMTQNNNERMMEAVGQFDLQTVRACLEDGADPNYWVKLTEDSEDDLVQPSTPLKLVMFRISDCMLEDDDLRQYAKIAKLLLHYGADPEPAMHIAKSRYGQYDPAASTDNCFMDVWRIVAEAARRK